MTVTTMLKLRSFKGLIPCSLALMPILAVAQTERELGAHVHGAAMMQVVLEGNSLLINLESPAANLVGFEHAPETAEEKQQIDDVKSRLGEVASVFAIAESAGCTASSAVVEWEMVGADEEEHEHEEHGHDDHAKHEDHDEHEHEEHEHEEHGHDDHEHEEGASHSEFHAAYTLQCADPGAIDRIEVLLFKDYPALETLSVQAVLPSGQTAATLTADNTGLSVRD